MRFLLLFICVISWQALAKGDNAYKQYENCINCHAEQYADWKQSDHYKAMNPPTSEYVLGDFSGIEVTHFTQKVKFYTQGNDYFMSFTEGEQTKQYKVEYTFGHDPLQQYLIKADNGRLQVFPFAWDSRPKSDGGQRWYVMYPDEDIQTNDRLHWQQPLQNWNGMCADCHSDGLKRNYSPKTDTFNTQWDNINVGCQSCHGDMSSHAQLMENSPSPTSLEYLQETAKLVGRWAFSEGASVAHWEGEKRDNRFMQSCFACHALRAPITDGFHSGVLLLDQFSVSLLDNVQYHADGQIKEEVYVYGSFLQSKMYEAGVNCTDCHNPHTMKVKTQTNGLCLQCHQPQTYQTENHLLHELGSEPAQCVSCHMPETTYMGVDARRDHSFKIPRPELTQSYGIPNACSSCHVDESPQWAAAKIKEHYPNKRPLAEAELLFIKLMNHGYLDMSQHLALINDASINVIYRASAIALLPNSTNAIEHNIIQPWLVSSEPLIRLATARIGALISHADKRKGYVNLLEDELRAVRVEAAAHLIDIPFVDPKLFASIYKELSFAREQSMWRGEGGLNKSLLYMQQNDTNPAVDALLHAIQVDPYFVPPYLNLSNLYQMRNNTQSERATFEKGLANNPNADLLLYSYALFHVRQNDLDAAIEQVLKAIKQAPTNPQYAYFYYLALDKQNKTAQALLQLRTNLKRYNNAPELIELGLYFAQKQQNAAQYGYFLTLKNAIR